MSESIVQRWQTLQNGVEQLFLVDGPMPAVCNDEVLVKIKAVSLNYRDTEVATGQYTHYQSLLGGKPDPIVPCSDSCGEVIAVGGGSKWQVGDRVISLWNQGHQTGKINPEILKTGLGLPLDGVLQTYRVFPSSGLVRAPAYMSDEEAASLSIAALTAWMAINQFRPIGLPGGRGETVVLQGTGGVSVSALQIANAAGAKTIITSSSDAKLEKAKALGADHVINYRTTPNWDETVMQITEGEGADIIVECGGAQTLRKSLGAIAFGGVVACIGYVSGKEEEGDRTLISLLALKRTAILKGIINGPRDRFEEMLEFYEKHEIHPVIDDRVFSFGEAKEAYKYLQKGLHFGKVVIKVSD